MSCIYLLPKVTHLGWKHDMDKKVEPLKSIDFRRKFPVDACYLCGLIGLLSHLKLSFFINKAHK